MSNPVDDAFDQLAQALSESMAPFAQAVITLANSISAVFVPTLESLNEVVKFTVEHLSELADKLHAEAGRPYGEGAEASMRWLHDQLQKWSKHP